MNPQQVIDALEKVTYQLDELAFTNTHARAAHKAALRLLRQAYAAEAAYEERMEALHSVQQAAAEFGCPY